MVRVDVPGVAVLLTVTVRTLLPLVGFGVKDAVTPLGSPVAARVTLPAKPYCGSTTTDVVPVPPWPIPGSVPPASVKFCAFTVSASDVVAVRPPELPVMVSDTDVAGAERLAARVKTLLPVVGLVLHDAVTPVGSAEVTARLTFPANPY